MKLRIGVVGLGDAWETRHRPALKALSDRFEVRAFCEQVAMRAQQAAQDFSATAVDGFRSLTSRPDVDAVLMLSPQWYGPLPILAACDFGKAIYCANTMDFDPEQAQSIKQRVEASGVAFMAELPRRHAPATLRLKELIATRLGPVKLMFCHRRVLVEEHRNGQVGWRTSSVDRDLMELVDWCRYVVGDEPTAVTGVARHDQPEDANEYEMLSLEFRHEQNVATAQISCGRYMPDVWSEAITFRAPAALQVSCMNGVAFVDLPSNLIWFDDAGRHKESLQFERPVGEQMLSQFHRAVTSLVRRTSDLEDAYRAVKVLLTAREGCRKGQRLPLDF